MSDNINDKITAIKELKNDHDRLFNIIRNSINEINATLPGTNQLGVCMSLNTNYPMLQSIEYNLMVKSDIVCNQCGYILKSRYGKNGAIVNSNDDSDKIIDRPDDELINNAPKLLDDSLTLKG
jgi:hypothetical protein